ncbi:hypothetical protein [Nitrosococcus wardiae]|uniref:DUF3955 domain-containing protein n=1 Tax=Nitrosococcus wardiae TaxID=1814290 RepID=A0A4P7C376_9GAMM|nr:hypothetical protein [Nitrosococcus wardiae]QBQ55346.1 hypothetical protein E3U44_13125 [Nitrosococcus wardiae]
MNRNKIGYILLGWFCIIGGMEGLLTGTTFGVGNLTTSSRDITFEDNPIEFILVIAFWLGFGSASIWSTLKKKE